MVEGEVAMTFEKDNKTQEIIVQNFKVYSF